MHALREDTSAGHPDRDRWRRRASPVSAGCADRLRLAVVTGLPPSYFAGWTPSSSQSPSPTTRGRRPRRSTAPSPPGCARARGGLRRPGPPAGRGLGAAHGDQIQSGRPHSWSCSARPAREDDARAHDRRARGRRVRGALGGQRRAPQVREVIARRASASAWRATIFFLDEIHRFNKAQQDALLPAVQDGTVTLVGATRRRTRTSR